MASTQQQATIDAWEDVQAIVRRFAQAWLSGRRPSLRRFLGQAKGHPLLTDLAFALARTDLNQRLLAGDDPPVEELLRVLEKESIQLDEARQLRLIRLEYDRRWWRGEPGVSRVEYQERFPEHREVIAGWTPLWTCPACKREDIPLPDEGAATVTCPNAHCPNHNLAITVPELFRVPAESAQAGLDVREYVFDENEDRIGEGGMGGVYRSRDPGLGRELALKVIRKELHGSQEGEWRFVQEAKITSRLEHPNIVPVHSIGRLRDGRLFYTMKLVRGQTLEKKLAACGAGVRARLGACLDDFERVCQAVAYAHHQGVIHRDLKPSNVMVGEFGQVQVMDWGLAKRVRPAGVPAGAPATDGEPLDSASRAGESVAPADLTPAGRLLGTPLYAAPEQFSGGTDRVGKAADVFALGALLCEVLTGYAPYRDAQDNPADPSLRGRIEALVKGEALWPGLERLVELNADPDLSPHRALIKLAEESLAREPATRPPDARTVAQRVADYQAATRQEAEEARIREAKLVEERKKRRFARLLALSLGVLLFGAVAAAIYFNYLSGENKTLADKNGDLARLEKNAREKEKVEREKAQASDRQSQLRLAETLLSRGRLDINIQRYQEARRSCLDAWDVFATQETPTATAEIGFWYACQHCAPPLFFYDLQSAKVRNLAISRDGRLGLARDEGNALSIWDLGTGRRLSLGSYNELYARFPGIAPGGPLPVEDKVLAWAFSDDGRRLATRTQGGVLTLYDAVSRRQLRTFAEKDDDLGTHSVILSPDGRWAVTTGMDAPNIGLNPAGGLLPGTVTPGTFTFWDAETGKKVRKVQAHENGLVFAGAFSRDSKLFATGSVFGQLKLWDASSGKLIRFYQGLKDSITCLAFSPNGKALLFGEEKTVKAMDLSSGRLLGVFEGMQDTVAAVAWSPEGEQVLAVDRSGTCELWAVGEAGLRQLVGHRAWIGCIAYSPDGRLVLSSGAVLDESFRLWDAATGRELHHFTESEGAVTAVAFSPDSTQALSGNEKGVLFWWDIAKGTILRKVPAHEGKVLCVAWSPDGSKVYSAGQDGKIRIGDAAKGDELATLEARPPVVFSPDGTRALCGNEQKKLVLWDMVTLAKLLSLDHDADDDVPPVIAANNGLAAVRSGKETIKLFDLTSGKELRTLPGHKQQIGTLALSPDGKVLLTGSWDRTLKLWDADTGRELCSLNQTNSIPSAAAFAPVGLAACTGDVDGNLILFDFDRARQYRAFETRLPKAIDTLKERPDDAEAFRLLGEWYAFRQRWNWAIDLLEQSRKQGGAAVSPTLARCRWQLRQHPLAQQEFQHALEEASSRQSAEVQYLRLCLKGVQRSEKVARERAKVLLEQGLQQALDGNGEAALSSLDEAALLDPDSREVYFQRGNLLFAKKDYARAVTNYTRVLEINPRDVEALHNRGLSYFQLKQYDGTIGDCTRALEIKPSFVIAYQNRGIAYLNKKDYPRALTDFDQVLARTPENRDVRYERAWTYYLIGDLDRAVSDADRLLEQNPKDRSTRFDRGTFFLARKDWKRARQDADKLVELHPGWSHSYLLRSLVRVRQGELREAATDTEKAIALNSQSVRAAAQRAVLQARQDNFAAALTALEELQKDSEADPWVWYATAQVHGLRSKRRVGAGQDQEAKADQEQALECLEHAVRNGFEEWAYVLADDSLESLQSEKRFKKMLPAGFVQSEDKK